MKRILALVLGVIMLLGVLASCSNSDEEKGATVPVYISSEIRDFDPVNCCADEASQKMIGLLFEGLVTVGSNGKIEGAAAESWTYEKDNLDGTYVLSFNLRYSAWSDGRQVSADDFVYAWKRIMEPEFQCEGCALLNQVKNALEVKRGDVSIDDFGIYAASTTIFQVRFDKDINLDEFLVNCASPYLFPLREDSVNKCPDFATNISSLVTNGKFTLRSFTLGETCVFERNIYYRRDVEKDSVKKYITPYRLKIDFTMTPEEQLNAFEDGSILFIGELPLEYREEYIKKVNLTDTMSTHTYVFNTTKAPFDNADVRNGLSKAIDREELANIIVYAEAATGIVNGSSIWENKSNKSFASVSGELISKNANMDEAKSLTKNASVKEFSITIKPDEVDKAVAEYCKKQWEQLGFKVTIVELESEAYQTPNEYDVYDNKFMDAYYSKDFDVIAIDLTAGSNNAESVLAPFAKAYSGSARNFSEKQFDDVPHVSGYDNETYNNLIEEALSAEDQATKLAKLHEAEKVLVADMPVMPLFLYKNAYMSNNKKISGLSTAAWRGYIDFSKCNYKGYLKDEEAALAAEQE